MDDKQREISPKLPPRRLSTPSPDTEPDLALEDISETFSQLSLRTPLRRYETSEEQDVEPRGVSAKGQITEAVLPGPSSRRVSTESSGIYPISDSDDEIPEVTLYPRSQVLQPVKPSTSSVRQTLPAIEEKDGGNSELIVCSVTEPTSVQCVEVSTSRPYRPSQSSVDREASRLHGIISAMKISTSTQTDDGDCLWLLPVHIMPTESTSSISTSTAQRSGDHKASIGRNMPETIEPTLSATRPSTSTARRDSDYETSIVSRMPDLKSTLSPTRISRSSQIDIGEMESVLRNLPYISTQRGRDYEASIVSHMPALIEPALSPTRASTSTAERDGGHEISIFRNMPPLIEASQTHGDFDASIIRHMHELIEHALSPSRTSISTDRDSEYEVSIFRNMPPLIEPTLSDTRMSASTAERDGDHEASIFRNMPPLIEPILSATRTSAPTAERDGDHEASIFRSMPPLIEPTLSATRTFASTAERDGDHEASIFRNMPPLIEPAEIATGISASTAQSDSDREASILRIMPDLIVPTLPTMRISTSSTQGNVVVDDDDDDIPEVSIYPRTDDVQQAGTSYSSMQNMPALIRISEPMPALIRIPESGEHLISDVQAGVQQGQPALQYIEPLALTWHSMTTSATDVQEGVTQDQPPLRYSGPFAPNWHPMEASTSDVQESVQQDQPALDYPESFAPMWQSMSPSTSDEYGQEQFIQSDLPVHLPYPVSPLISSLRAPLASSELKDFESPEENVQPDLPKRLPYPVSPLMLPQRTPLEHSRHESFGSPEEFIQPDLPIHLPYPVSPLMSPENPLEDSKEDDFVESPDEFREPDLQQNLPYPVSYLISPTRRSKASSYHTGFAQEPELDKFTTRKYNNFGKTPIVASTSGGQHTRDTITDEPIPSTSRQADIAEEQDADLQQFMERMEKVLFEQLNITPASQVQEIQKKLNLPVTKQVPRRVFTRSRASSSRPWMSAFWKDFRPSFSDDDDVSAPGEDISPAEGPSTSNEQDADDEQEELSINTLIDALLPVPEYKPEDLDAEQEDESQEPLNLKGIPEELLTVSLKKFIRGQLAAGVLKREDDSSDDDDLSPTKDASSPFAPSPYIKIQTPLEALALDIKTIFLPSQADKIPPDVLKLALEGKRPGDLKRKMSSVVGSSSSADDKESPMETAGIEPSEDLIKECRDVPERNVSSIFGSPSDSGSMENPRNATGIEISDDYMSECREKMKSVKGPYKDKVWEEGESGISKEMDEVFEKISEKLQEQQTFSPVAKLCVFPPPGLGRLEAELIYNDVRRLRPSRWLNDEIVNLYLQYMVNVKYLFNKKFITVFPVTFFESFQRFLRFKRGRMYDCKENIFDKRFIIVPVSFSNHWMLFVICYPGLINLNIESYRLTAEEYNDELTDNIKKCTKLQPPNCSMYRPNTLVSRYATPKRPCILVLNSLEGYYHQCQFRGRLLRLYVKMIWDKYVGAKFGATIALNGVNFPMYVPPVPQQNNLSDCGVFILHFAEKIISNPLSIQGFPPDLRFWFDTRKILVKRQQILDLCFSLFVQQQEKECTCPDNTEKTKPLSYLEKFEQSLKKA